MAGLWCVLQSSALEDRRLRVPGLPMEEEDEGEAGVAAVVRSEGATAMATATGMELEDGGPGEGEDENEEDGGVGGGRGEGEGDAQQEEEEYSFEFGGGMDPVDVVEADAVEVEPYRLFERLEYEALAERKRKALFQQRGDEYMKKPRQEDTFGANFDEILEALNHNFRRKSRQPKRRGRRKGFKKRLNPEITRKLGDATLYYATGRYDEAIQLLKDVLQLAPNLSDVYHTLGLIYNATGDRKKALTYYMFAAHLAPKDPSLWKLLVAWSIEQGNTGQARHCLRKAIKADPQDIGLKFDYALLYIEVGEYQEAWKSLEEIVRQHSADVKAQTKAAMMYRKCGQANKAIKVLEDFINKYSFEADMNMFSLLVELLMENNSHRRALQYIEQAKSIFCSGKDLPLYLTVKAGICQLHLGEIENAKVQFQCLLNEKAEYTGNLILEVADSFSNVGLYDYALNYYSMLEETTFDQSVYGFALGCLQLKIGQCHLSLNERARAIPYFYKALHSLEDDIDARITLSSLLVEEDKIDEAVSLLSPPSGSVVCTTGFDFAEPGSWWLNGRIKMQLAKIYHKKGMLQEFVDTILLPMRQTLLIEAMNEKVKTKKRLSTSDLLKRVKLLDEHEHDSVFRGFKPIAKTTDLLKACRARKLLRKKEKKEKKKEDLAGSLDWQIEGSEDESHKYVYREPPLSNLLKDEEHYQLISDLCSALVSLQQYWDALEIIKMLSCSTLSNQKKEELQTLGVQIAPITRDAKHGYDYVRHFVQRHPCSSAAWHCYYKVVSRLEYPYAKHLKFLHEVREARKDCVPPMIITGHQFAVVRYQSAAREYLQAYKLQPDNALINLCVGTSLINLALGFRLKNKHLCVMQGIAFLNNYLDICQNSQEALYNIARAYHIVGHYTLAASYYEKVLAIEEKDYPMPKLPNENSSLPEILKPGYCNLHTEAAYNLHLIYRKSGALDLARQVLKNYCSP